MKKIIIDRHKCIGCGACTMIAPNTFCLDKEGKSTAIGQEGDSKETVKNAAENCPVKAISYEE